MTSRPERDPGSFRDPRGHVYSAGEAVLRNLSQDAARDFKWVNDTGLIDDLIRTGKLIGTREVDSSALFESAESVRMVLRHDRIPVVTYPYEWSYSLLKAAALHHLDIQLAALSRNVALTDSSAYNVQFVGAEPMFIDVLSFRPYREGEPWSGYRQFCEQFLNPLLLRAYFGIPHNPWFRGSLEGIETEYLAAITPWWRCASLNVLTHVKVHAALQARARRERAKAISRARKVTLPRQGFTGMLSGLRAWIGRLAPLETAPTVWQEYAEATTYRSVEHDAKREFISEFCRRTRPSTLLDLGCNTGEYAELALISGATRVIGLDADHGALERAFARAKEKSLDFLPLYQDSANPTPAQGWRNRERPSLGERCRADAMLALAFAHHLAIGRNVPLGELADWLVSHAPSGVIEFVEKNDPTVQEMLALRDDVFADYGREAFESQLKTRCRIVRSERISSTGRTLYWFDRR